MIFLEASPTCRATVACLYRFVNQLVGSETGYAISPYRPVKYTTLDASEMSGSRSAGHASITRDLTRRIKSLFTDALQCDVGIVRDERRFNIRPQLRRKSQKHSRHLSNLDLTQASQLFSFAKPTPTVGESAVEFLNLGMNRFEEVNTKRNLCLAGFGAFEVAIVIDGEFPERTTDVDFYMLLQLNKPRHTGWSLWMGGRAGPTDETSYVYGNAWETLVDSSAEGCGIWQAAGEFDFWRAEPVGRFYHRRSLWDDLRSEAGVVPKTQLDFALHTRHVTEAVSIGSYFARALGCDERSTTLGFACRWSGLEGRHLCSWSEPGRSFYSSGAAVEDVTTTHAVMPLETPPTAFSSIVESLVAPMFALFGGWRFESIVIEQIVKKTLAERY